MKEWMYTKTAGLPRWAWVSLASGAVLLGLYLRSRAAKSETVEGEEGTGTGEVPEGGLAEYYNGTEGGAGLAGVGLYGGTAGQVVPVQAPVIPEGFVESFTEAMKTISELGGYITSEHERETERGEAEGVTGIESGVTGGGAPAGGGTHTPTNKAAIHRLEKEIKALQNEIKSLTAHIKQYKKQYAPLSKHDAARKQVHSWEVQRAADQGAIAAKRAQLKALKVAA